MIYLLFVFVAVLSVLVAEVYGARKGVVKLKKVYKKCEEKEIAPFEGVTLILITIVCFAVAVAIQISLYKNTSILNFIKLYGLFLIVLAAAIVDAKRRIIPNLLVLIGLVFRIGIYVYEFFTVDDIKTVLINDLIGFAIGFGFLAIVSLVTKGALGFGDVKLFGIIGILSGSFCTYSTLLVSLVITTVFSLIKMGAKKMTRKDSVPFGPSIAIGYILAVLLTSY